MRFALAQIHTVLGDFSGNLLKIRQAYEEASRRGARFMLCSELVLSAYSPMDLSERPEFLEQSELALKVLKKCTEKSTCALILGHASRSEIKGSWRLQNRASVLEKGEIVFSQAKTLLPNYDVFDESRIFDPAKSWGYWLCDGLRVGLAICEDTWGSSFRNKKRLYPENSELENSEKSSLSERYKQLKLDLLCVLAASPFEKSKTHYRLSIHQDFVRKLGIPLLYVNQLSATEELIFDGQSFYLSAQAELMEQLPAFSAKTVLVDLNKSIKCKPLRSKTNEPNWGLVVQALVFGIKHYFQVTGFKRAVLGLSGGIDSSVVAGLASLALGPDQLLCLAMPSQYSSPESWEDAAILSTALGVRLETQSIKFLYSVFKRNLSEGPFRSELASSALENLQARMRASIAMALANHDNALLLSTGNKSEIALGYCTLYGDMAGALAPIGDLYKTEVYLLARELTAHWGIPIPERCFSKAPSAELRENQKDQDSLPPYEQLDALLVDFLEQGLSVKELQRIHGKSLVKSKLAAYAPQDWVLDVLRRIERNEHKRRQAAPILRVSAKSFGLGRQMPIAHSFFNFQDCADLVHD